MTGSPWTEAPKADRRWVILAAVAVLLALVGAAKLLVTTRAPHPPAVNETAPVVVHAVHEAAPVAAAVPAPVAVHPVTPNPVRPVPVAAPVPDDDDHDEVAPDPDTDSDSDSDPPPMFAPAPAQGIPEDVPDEPGDVPDPTDDHHSGEPQGD